MNSSNADWNSEFDSVDFITSEQVKTPNWIEVSLGSDDEQEMKGTLQFRKDSKSYTDILPANFEDEPPPPTESEESETGSNGSEPTSLAYQLGMMVVSRAATAVNKVADGGKKNRDVIKQLRSDLEDMKHKYEVLELEFENSKQWIKYYESIKNSLENQIEEGNKRFSTQHKSMQDKLQTSETEIESCRREVANAAELKQQMTENMEEARKTIKYLTSQVHAAEQQISQQSRHDQISKPNPNCSSTQTEEIVKHKQTDEIPHSTPPSSLISMKLQRKERQLKDAIKALSLAHARGDKLRHQLMTSMESMKSHTSQMKASRAALDHSLSVASDLKVSLSNERVSKDEIEEALKQEKEERQRNSLEVEKQQKTIETLKCDSEKMRIELSEKKSQIEMIEATNARTSQERSLSHFAEMLVSDALHNALTHHLQEIHTGRIVLLQRDSEAKFELATRTNSALTTLQDQVVSLERKLKCKMNELIHSNARVASLEGERRRRENELTVKAEAEKELKSALRSSRTMFDQLKLKLENSIKTRVREMEQLRGQVNAISIENSELKMKLGKTMASSKQSLSSQTDICDSNAEELKVQISEAVILQNQLRERLVASQSENIRLQNEVDGALEKNDRMGVEEEYLAKVQYENRELQLVVEENRRVAYERNHILERLEDYCRRLDWTCRDQYSKILQLRQENASLRRNDERQPVVEVSDSVNGANLPEDRDYSAGVPARDVDSLCGHQSEVTSGSQDETKQLYLRRDNDLDQGDVVIKRLDTIMEADEKSSSSDQRSSNPTAKPETCSGSTVSSHCDKSESVHETDESVSTLPRVPKRRRRRSKEKLKVSANSPPSPPALPIWRRENPRNAEYVPSSGDSGSRVTVLNHEVVSYVSDDDDDVFYLSAQAAATSVQERRIGIPMSGESFRRVMAGESTRPLHWCGDVESSRDDGYSSSTNSVLDEMHQQNQIWESSGFSTPRNIPDNNSSDRNLNGNTDSAGRRHHYVTFAGSTFDLGNFSMVNMREVTSTCDATSTQEGMKAFCEFMAHKVEELDDDPTWRGAHSLGKPNDWLSLKTCFS